jgi:hypothetical protein
MITDVPLYASRKIFGAPSLLKWFYIRTGATIEHVQDNVMIQPG